MDRRRFLSQLVALFGTALAWPVVRWFQPKAVISGFGPRYSHLPGYYTDHYRDFQRHHVDVYESDFGQITVGRFEDVARANAVARAIEHRWTQSELEALIHATLKDAMYQKNAVLSIDWDS